MKKLPPILLVTVLFYLVWHLRIYRIDGTSMNYGLIEDDLVVTWRGSGAIDRGDLVVIRHPDDPSGRLYFKRCVALPEDRYFVKNRAFFLQLESNATLTHQIATRYGLPSVTRPEGVFLQEPYRRFYPVVHDPNLLPPKVLRHQPLSLVPPDHYYTLGDFRDNSADSRIYGAVPREWILSRAILIMTFPHRWEELIAIEEADER